MNADPHSEPTDRDLAAGEVVELTVLARQAGVKIVHVRRYVEFGLIEPHPADADAERFDPANASRVARAERLRRDLGLNYAGAVLVCELLDRISELEAGPH
ncbi:MAG: chaperone modulator CbpM [Solirubrobacteraceae bacterium]|jgi:DNA-binding transcriptional MerR regulator